MLQKSKEAIKYAEKNNLRNCYIAVDTNYDCIEVVDYQLYIHSLSLKVFELRYNSNDETYRAIALN